MTRRCCPEPADDISIGYLDPRAQLSDPDTVTQRRLEALQDAVTQFNDNFKHAVLTPLTYPEPPEWLKPLVRDLNAALEASKAE